MMEDLKIYMILSAEMFIYYDVLPSYKVFRWNTYRVGGCCYRQVVPLEQMEFR